MACREDGVDMTLFQRIKQHAIECGWIIPSFPTFPSDEIRQLQIQNMDEEFSELVHAETEDDIVKVADALGDIIQSALYYGSQYGIDMDAVLEEIHASNLTKINKDGSVLRHQNGKIMKGPDYLPPNIKKVLGL